MFGKLLITHQTGPKGKEVKRVYIEEASDIETEFYLSCLLTESSSKIAFISSTSGGMDIEKVAKDTPNKITTVKFEFKPELSEKDVKKVLNNLKLNTENFNQAEKIVNAIYQILIKKDATLIEINPLIITKDGEIKCLDAKINFDDNAIFRRPEILKTKRFKRGRCKRNRS